MSFDPAALFLLDIGYLNLFEPTETTVHYTCKGCRERVPVEGRRKHYDQHKRDRERDRRKRADQITKERVANLARARKRKEIHA